MLTTEILKALIDDLEELLHYRNQEMGLDEDEELDYETRDREIWARIELLKGAFQKEKKMKILRLTEDFEIDMQHMDGEEFTLVFCKGTTCELVEDDGDELYLTRLLSGDWKGGEWYFPKDILEEVEG